MARKNLFCKLTTAAAAVALATPLASADLPAFSGAEGPGANATGGRGGDVYHVTNLEADTAGVIPGSLRYGIATAPAEGRTIVFDVGGVIRLPTEGPTTSKWFNSGASNITIAGQTAPGPGITIAGNGAKMSGSNVILQHVAFRPGPHANHPTNTNDGLSLQLQNSIVSHVSTTWATDEGLSLTDNGMNTTVQYSLIAETLSDGNHHFGSLISSEHDDALISFHHNLYAHARSRLPRIGNEKSAGAIVNFSNNIIYNWNGRAAYSIADKPARANFLANYYIAGPEGVSTDRVFYSPDGNTRIYHDGNMVDMDKDGVLDGVAFNFSGPQMEGTFTNEITPFNVESGYVQTAEEAYDQVLAYVGARWWARDNIDARIINDAGSVGTSGAFLPTIPDLFNMPTYQGYEFPHESDTGLPAYAAVYRAANWDADGDGMPDQWEAAHDLDPNATDNNGDFDNDGYTNLEEYIQDIAPIPAPLTLGFTNTNGNGRYAEIGNWATGNWQPSGYDNAQINAGTVAVDAVGQHAGNLTIASNAGDNAALHITDGWLIVENQLLIGGDPAGQGTLNLTGGALHAHILAKGAAGAFNMTGGELHADIITFDLVNQGGTLAPGHSVGMTYVMGNLTLESGALQIELESDTSFDTLLVDGTLTLGGQLDVLLLGAYAAEANERWLIAEASQIEGAFDGITPGFTVEVDGGELYLAAVPEPGSISAGLIAVVPLLMRCRRSRSGRSAG